MERCREVCWGVGGGKERCGCVEKSRECGEVWKSVWGEREVPFTLPHMSLHTSPYSPYLTLKS